MAETIPNDDADMIVRNVRRKKAAARPPNRTPPRQSVPREPERIAVRSTGEVIGRNGEVLSRKRTGVGDIFHIPANLIPRDWDYQWNAVSVIGNTEVLMDQNLMMAENGWRPVPAERHPGRFMPPGHKGSIVRGGMRLDERPMVLSKEARAEDVRNARQLITDRNDSLKLTGMKSQLAEGFEMGKRYRGTGGDIRMSIDPALDAPVPKHDLAGPED